MSENPYAAPSAVVSEQVGHSREDKARLQRVASGQRMMVWAVLGYFVSNMISGGADGAPLRLVVGGLLAIACVVFAIIGAVRLGRALGDHMVTCVVVAIFMIVPLLNLIVMVVMSSRATKALKVAGYKVGFMGARDI